MLQVQAALMQSAGLAGMSVGQLQALLAGQQEAAGAAAGMARSHSSSAVMQQHGNPRNARFAAALQAQVSASACSCVGRLGLWSASLCSRALWGEATVSS